MAYGHTRTFVVIARVCFIIGFVVACPPLAASGAAEPAPELSDQAESPCEVFQNNKGRNDQEQEEAAKPYGIKLYRTAQLPQPYPGVLSSNVLPAEGLSRLTLEGRVDKIEQSCIVAFLVDDVWGWRGQRRLHFRSVNVDVFKDTTSGRGSTRIFFTIPANESPPRRLYKPATLILGAYPKAGGDPMFSFSLPVHISNRNYARWGAILFGVGAYLCAALAAWKTTGSRGRPSFSLNPVQITASVFGGGSLSQLQVFFFSLLVGSLVFFLWLWTGLLSNISPDLLMLMGISAVGAVGAKYTATLKSQLNEDTQRFLYAEGWFSGDNIGEIHDRPRLGDLLLTNNRLDVYKFQMAMFSVLVAIYILRTGATDLGEVKISETLLYLIGISQGVYIGGKAISERENTLEERVKSLMALKAAYAVETDATKKKSIADDYKNTATAARADFEALMNIKVDDKKLELT